MAIKYSSLIIGNRLTSLNTDIGAGGKLRIYSGSRPASVNTAISAQVLLSEQVTGSPFGVVGSGALTANAIANGTAVATGTATWFRVFKADGTTACVDGDVATSGADLNLSSTSINSGQTVSISSFVITGQPV